MREDDLREDNMRDDDPTSGAANVPGGAGPFPVGDSAEVRPWVSADPPGAGYAAAHGQAWDDAATPTVPLEPRPAVAAWTPARDGALGPAPVGPTGSGKAGGRGPQPGISRRAVLAGAGAGALGLGAMGVGLGLWFARESRAGNALGSAISVSELAGAGQMLHLLRRAGFGARPSELGAYLQLGVSGAIERLLNPAAVADDLDTHLAALNLDFTKVTDLQRWFLLRMLYSQRPLEEKMTLFWHGLLTSGYRKLGKAVNHPLMIQQNQLLRTHAFGRFDDLIRAVSTDPAMMHWLDLLTSTAAAPNENYARELMELFTMGIGNYTQDDVVAGAHALTGWVVRGTQGVFVPRRHDNGTKTYLGDTGNLGLDDVVRLVCAHPATGPHLALRLWTFFAYEQPSTSDLQPLVDAYEHQDHNIGAMMRALLTSPAFFSAQAYRARIKSPVEFVVGALRALELPTDAQRLPAALTLMGQSLFDPPNVAGWDGDKASAAWMATGAWMTRLNVVNALVAAAGSAAGGTQAGGSVLQRLIDQHQLAAPQDLVDYFVALLLDDQLTGDRRAAITDYLAQSGGAAGPALTFHAGARAPAAAVRGALYLVMSLPEYQLN
jgi:uncharacterized protein (DUF1800 family)